MVREIIFPKILQPFHCNDLVRLGKNNDGGYLVNLKDVLDTDLLLSFGIGTDISFEKDFTELRNCSMAAFDGTVDITDPFFNDIRKFHKRNIGLIHTEDTVEFQSILNSTAGNVFVKCDIDGCEYDLFDQFIRNSTRFSGIAIEVHDTAKYENFDRLTDFISKINMNLIHVHINNYSYYDTDGKITPNVLELTFSSDKRLELDRNLTLPHKLDMPNNPDGEDFLVRF